MKGKVRANVICIFALALIIGIVGCTHEVKIIKTVPVDVRILDEGTAPAPGWQASCTNDADCDGFSDSMEAQGFTLTGSNNLHFPKCTGGARENCVDPDTRDLFVILERADTGTLIPATSPSFQPFEFIAKDVSSGGLGITVHEVSVSEGDIASSRQVTQASDQKAVRVDENNTRSDFSDDCTGSPINVPLGWTSNPGQGLPEDGLYSTVNTKNIVGYIDNYCEEISGQCKDASTPPVVGADNECDLGGGGVTLGELDSLDHLLIKYIIAHEVAHNLKLRWKHTNKNGWHHSAGSGTIMEKSVKVDDGTDVVFHISDNFDLECQKAARVWE